LYAHKNKLKEKKLLSEAKKKKPFTKIELVEWLKVNAMSSSPSTERKKETRKRKANKTQRRHGSSGRISA
jgi:hypothetical protein